MLKTALGRNFSVFLIVGAIGLILALPGVCRAEYPKSDAKAVELLKAMEAKAGTYQDLQKLKDVEYVYTYRDNKTGNEDISTERYLFDGELSWAVYDQHTRMLPPDHPMVPVVQGFDGEDAWVTVDGKVSNDEKLVGRSLFLRKTNFYWFAMMHKLLDPGTIHKYKGTREANGIEYEMVEVGFDVPKDTPADTYLLYINPKTGLVDQFLFTVVDFGLIEKPLLMTVEYEKFDSVMLPVTRKYTATTGWEGEVAGNPWVDEIMTEIKFGNGFEREDFAKPSE